MSDLGTALRITDIAVRLAKHVQDLAAIVNEMALLGESLEQRMTALERAQAPAEDGESHRNEDERT